MRFRATGVAVLIVAVVLAVLAVRSFTGGDGDGFGRLDDVLGQVTGDTTPVTTPAPVDSDTPLARFVDFVFDDAQTFWAERFAEAGLPYEPAQLALHGGRTASACGIADESLGPFYCPADGGVYIDLQFLAFLERFGAPGDMAQAYVVAHEVAHHVQDQLGISDQVAAAQEADPGRANDLSVRLELQADCLAGVWANSTRQRGLLEPGDIEEGLGAAAAVGDDRIQAETTGRIEPDLFTHGTSAQRQAWFLRGFETGDPNACDTFSTDL